MAKKDVQRKINWSPEDRARHQAIRKRFQRYRPAREELAQRPEGETLSHRDYLDLVQTMVHLKRERERRGLSLTDVAECSRIDKAALSRLENGLHTNPTVDTLLRYLDAIGLRLVWTFEDVGAPPRSTNGARTTETRHIRKGRK